MLHTVLIDDVSGKSGSGANTTRMSSVEPRNGFAQVRPLECIKKLMGTVCVASASLFPCRRTTCTCTCHASLCPLSRRRKREQKELSKPLEIVAFFNFFTTFFASMVSIEYFGNIQVTFWKKEKKILCSGCNLRIYSHLRIYCRK